MGDVVPDGVRAVGLFGHGGSGKTTLAEAILYSAGALDRRGKVDDGTSAMDQEPEEQRRHMSLSLAVGSAQVQGKWLYLVDTPGYLDFLGEARATERVVDLALLVVDAAQPVEVGFELEYQRLQEQGKPCMIFVNKLDRENASAADALAALREACGNRTVALSWPLGQESHLHGSYEVWSGQSRGLDGKPLDERPDDAADLREHLCECVAEADDEAIEHYLEEGDLTDELLRRATAKAVADGAAVPVVFGSAASMSGVASLLSALLEFGPGPRPVALEDGEEFRPDPGAEAAALVFKTTADPHVGRLSLLRVMQGTVRSDSHLINVVRGQDERLGQLYRLRGQKQEAAQELGPGEIGAVARLQETKTGDTLAVREKMPKAPPIAFDEPVFRMSLKARSTADEDRLSGALGRLLEEDPTLRLEHPSGHETVVAGLGEMHLEVLHDRLKRKFGVDVAMELPEVPFRETIRGQVKVEGKHKKQTGGHGQFGHVWLELSPCDGEFVFEDKIFGGVVPSQYRPAVEKGVVEAMAQGILAGYPVTGVRCALVDGSYHPVDSSEMAFKVAGALAFREGAQKAKPVLLEPVDEIWVDCPESTMGDIIGVINRKRGRVLGMESRAGRSEVHAFVPRIELQRYAIELRSLAGGRATFRQSFAQYEEVPAQIAQQIIEKAKEAAR